MRKKLLFLFLLYISLSSCSKDEEVFPEENENLPEEKENLPEEDLSDYEIKVIDYFQDIALGFEVGDATEVTRKWKGNMKIFVGGNPDEVLLVELERVKNELNALASDGFSMEVVNDTTQANYYIFFGSGTQFAQIYPSLEDLVKTNWGFFSVSYNSQNYFTSGRMYVDTHRANQTEQRHLLREELTQSLGLAQDSPLYPESIFQVEWTHTTEFSEIDKDLIRLLYHPDMEVGADEEHVEDILMEILIAEKL